jgi:hypothetical protein
MTALRDAIAEWLEAYLNDATDTLGADDLISLLRERDDVILDAAPLLNAIRKVEEIDAVSDYGWGYAFTDAEFAAWNAALGEDA